jgi:small GTP-binding protein
MTKNDEYYDLIFKTVIIGDSGVGKSNLLSRYLNNSFSTELKTTVGVEFGAKKLNIQGKMVKAQIWDTAGQERYRSITSAYYKGAKGGLLVFDLTNEESFNSIDKWLKELKQECESDLVIVLVGNKSDLTESRKVSFENAMLKAQGLGKTYFCTK